MSILAIGLSHHSAPLEVLEAAALTPAGVHRLLERVARSDSVSEVLVLSTCNRLEVYAEVPVFHAALTDIGAALAAATATTADALSAHLYVHFEDRAIAHLFSVAAGLDSMAVGEAQVLGQLRSAMRTAREGGFTGSELELLGQTCLRVAKRVHSTTDIDRVARSLVETGLAAAVEHLRAASSADTDRSTPSPTRVLLVGAGSMSGLAAATVRRALPDADLVVVSRTPASAQRLASAHGGRAAEMAGLAEAIGEADLVIAATGARGYVVHPSFVDERRPRAFVDLALPRDVDPLVGRSAGQFVVDLEQIGARLAIDDDDRAREVSRAREFVTGEVAAFIVERSTRSAGPTVAALRARASEVVAAELVRLAHKTPSLTEAERSEIERSVNRIVDKLLHAPTTRVKQLAAGAGGVEYAAALRLLFDLGPHEPALVDSAEAVARADRALVRPTTRPNRPDHRPDHRQDREHVDRRGGRG